MGRNFSMPELGSFDRMRRMSGNRKARAKARGARAKHRISGRKNMVHGRIESLLPVMMGVQEVLDDVVVHPGILEEDGGGTLFGISPQKLDFINASKETKVLEIEGGVESLSEKLLTSLDSGIDTESRPQTLEQREKFYGKNQVERAKTKGFFHIVGEQLSDPTVRLLMVAAVVSLVLGLAIPEERKNKNYIDGIAIWVAVFAVSFIGALNDYQKEKQFRKLNSSKESSPVKVIRDGRIGLIPSSSVVCGDIVLLETGDKIVADGIFLSSGHLCVDEAALTGESEQVVKGKDDPFCRAGTQVTEGGGKMLVIGVGSKSEWGKTIGLVLSDREDTPLQQKLGQLATDIGKVGIAVALICFVTLSIHWLIENKGFRPEKFNDIVRFFLFSVTIVVVAVPEGLPLAVTISLAYSMKKMMKDNNFVRSLAACETMGGATVICSDKTGTLTENRMTVVSGWFADTTYRLAASSCAVSASVLHHLALGISTCTTAFILFEGMNLQLVGSRTECALLLLLEKLGINYEDTRSSADIVEQLKFNSDKKLGGARVSGPHVDLIYCIGAAEVVLGTCSKYLSEAGECLPMLREKSAEAEEMIVTMSKQGLRTLCLAFKEVSKQDKIPVEHSLVDMCVFGIVGIKDPIRPEVPQAVRDCNMAGIQVKMVTGDNVHTACHIAKDCGILRPTSKILEGPSFRTMEDSEIIGLLPDLAVLARSSPSDKHRLVRLLKARGDIVAVTGDGTNDAPALKESDVGLAMGKCGTDVAKEASDIVILDDNFASIVKAVLWGRSVFNNIRKFLQFQLTINAVALLLSFVGTVTKKGMPLSVLQLLWVNLIMDSLAALALATEPPANKLLRQKPNDRKKPLISKCMWKHILVQGTYQFSVLLLILYALPLLDGYKFPDNCRVDYDVWVSSTFDSSCRINAPIKSEVCLGNGLGTCEAFQMQWDTHLRQEARYDDAQKARVKEVNSLIFNTFILCQIFNAFNSRKVSDELNVFQGIFLDRTFLYIICIILGFQIIIMQYLGDFFHVVKLSVMEWLFCAIAGILSVPLSAITKLISSPKRRATNIVHIEPISKDAAWLP